MEQRIRKDSRPNRRKTREFSPQIHQRQHVEPCHSRSASTHTDNTLSESIFSASIDSTSTRTSHESLTLNNLEEHTWSDLRHKTSYNGSKGTRDTHTGSRRTEEVRLSGRSDGVVYISNRGMSHKWNSAWRKPCRSKATVYHDEDEKRTDRPRAHPVYLGVYPHQLGKQASLEIQGHQASPQTSLQPQMHADNDIIPILTYAHKKPECGKEMCSLFNDRIQRTAKWLFNQDHYEFFFWVSFQPDLETRIEPVEDAHIEKTGNQGSAEIESSYSYEHTTEYQSQQRFRLLDSNHKDASGSKISYEPASTDITEKNAKEPSIVLPIRKKALQLTLPFRARRHETTLPPNPTIRVNEGTQSTPNRAYSQANEEVIPKQSDSYNSTGTRKRKTRRTVSKDEPEEDSNDDNDDDNDDRRNNRRMGGKSYKGKEAALPFLACPYFKHNPTRYSGSHWRNCCGPGWKDVHRMKEHLYRHHRQPKFVCTRCGSAFREEADLKDHTREIVPCVLQKLEAMDGFDSKQEDKLRSRKRTVTELSEAEKWKHTYKILFPHVPEEQIPSPFYDYVRPSHSEILRDYQEYARREIRGSLWPVLERELEAMNMTEATQKVADLFDKLNLRMISQFSSSREQGMAMSPASTSGSTGITPEVPEARTSLEPFTPLTAEQPQSTGDSGALNLNTALGFTDDFDFDFNFYTDGRDLQVMVEPFSNGGGSKPSDSAYGSMSIKGSSECS